MELTEYKRAYQSQVQHGEHNLLNVNKSFSSCGGESVRQQNFDNNIFISYQLETGAGNTKSKRKEKLLNFPEMEPVCLIVSQNHLDSVLSLTGTINVEGVDHANQKNCDTNSFLEKEPVHVDNSKNVGHHHTEVLLDVTEKESSHKNTLPATESACSINSVNPHDGYTSSSSTQAGPCENDFHKPKFEFAIDVKSNDYSNDEISLLETRTYAKTIKREVEEQNASETEQYETFKPKKDTPHDNNTLLNIKAPAINGRKKKHRCKECGKCFIDFGRMQDHIRIHTGERPFTCPGCDKSFTSFRYMVAHSKIHSGIKEFNCTQCDKSFRKREVLQKHMRMHAGIKPFSCVVCEKQYTDKRPLIKHVRSLHSDEFYFCNQCKKCFVDETQFDNHVKIHIKENPFICSKCNKGFPCEKTLQEHLQIHNFKISYNCTVCDKSFTTAWYLKTHSKLHSNNNDMAKCTLCDKRFACSSSLRKHAIICKFRQKKKNCSNNLTVYCGKIKPGKRYRPKCLCYTCGKSFRDTYLHEHEKTHLANRPVIKCTQCEKSFYEKRKLNRHIILVHENQRPYLCNVCGKSYKTGSILKEHMMIHEVDPVVKVVSFNNRNRKRRVKHKSSKCPQKELVSSMNSQGYHLGENTSAFIKIGCKVDSYRQKPDGSQSTYTERESICADDPKENNLDKDQLLLTGGELLYAPLKSPKQNLDTVQDYDKELTEYKGEDESQVQHGEQNLLNVNKSFSTCVGDSVRQQNFDNNIFNTNLLETGAHNAQSKQKEKLLNFPEMEPVCLIVSQNHLDSVLSLTGTNVEGVDHANQKNCDKNLFLEKEPVHVENSQIVGHRHTEVLSDVTETERTHKNILTATEKEPACSINSVNPDDGYTSSSSTPQVVTCENDFHKPKFEFAIDVKSNDYSQDEISLLEKRTYAKTIKREVEEQNASETEQYETFKPKKYIPHHNNTLLNIKAPAINGRKKKHRCKECGKCFIDFGRMQDHIRIHTGERPFTCPGCDKSFTSFRYMVAHSKIHSGIKEFNCTQCDKSFRKREVLQKHMRMHAGIKPFSCVVCEKQYTDKRPLIKHVRSLHSEEFYFCNQCKNCFVDETQFDNHVKIHIKENPFVCSKCNKSFPCEKTLEEHFEIHNFKVSYNCTVCDQSFTTAWYLKTHSKLHSNKHDMAKCTLCDKRFASTSSLRKHAIKCKFQQKKENCSNNLTVYSGQNKLRKRYKSKCLCYTCGKSFSNTFNLHEHEKTHLANRPVMKCTQCEKSFYDKRKLNRHIILVHENQRPYLCNVCGKSYKSGSLLKEHMIRPEVDPVVKVLRLNNRNCKSPQKVLISSKNSQGHHLGENPIASIKIGCLVDCHRHKPDRSQSTYTERESICADVPQENNPDKDKLLLTGSELLYAPVNSQKQNCDTVSVNHMELTKQKGAKESQVQHVEQNLSNVSKSFSTCGDDSTLEENFNNNIFKSNQPETCGDNSQSKQKEKLLNLPETEPACAIESQNPIDSLLCLRSTEAEHVDSVNQKNCNKNSFFAKEPVDAENSKNVGHHYTENLLNLTKKESTNMNKLTGKETEPACSINSENLNDEYSSSSNTETVTCENDSDNPKFEFVIDGKSNDFRTDEILLLQNKTCEKTIKNEKGQNTSETEEHENIRQTKDTQDHNNTQLNRKAPSIRGHKTKNNQRCKECGKCFAHLSRLQQHIRTHTGERPFSCPKCEKSFTAFRYMVAHAKTHSEDMEFNCTHCDKRFRFKYNLLRHMITHSGSRPFSCVVCEKQYAAKVNLIHHVKSNHSQKVFYCNQCKKCFVDESQYDLHIKMHIKETLFVCSECKKGFPCENTLKEHFEIHTLKVFHNCKVCDKSFTSASYLKRHSNSNCKKHDIGKSKKHDIGKCNKLLKAAKRKNKPLHICPTCGKSFKKASYLRLHEQIHLTNRPSLKCSQCEKTLYDKSSLKRHIKQVHEGLRPYLCSKCGATYKTRAALQEHVRAHSGIKPHVCIACGKDFVFKKHLKQHQHIHTPLTFMEKDCVVECQRQKPDESLSTCTERESVCVDDPQVKNPEQDRLPLRGIEVLCSPTKSPKPNPERVC